MLSFQFFNLIIDFQDKKSSICYRKSCLNNDYSTKATLELGITFFLHSLRVSIGPESFLSVSL